MDLPQDNLTRMLSDNLPRHFLRWSALGLLAAALAAGAMFWMSIPQKARNSYEEAQRMFETGKYSSALYAANDALLDRSQRLKVYKLRAEIYRSLQQPKAAVEDLGRVITLEPGVAEHYSVRARAYVELGDAASAMKDYTKVIEMAKSAEAYHDRGMSYLKLNENAKAIEDFTHAIEMEPRADFYMQRGLARSIAGDQQQAIDDLTRGAELEPHSMTAMYCLRARAAAKLKLGDRAGNEADLQKALEVELEHSLGAAR